MFLTRDTNAQRSLTRGVQNLNAYCQPNQRNKQCIFITCKIFMYKTSNLILYNNFLRAYLRVVAYFFYNHQDEYRYLIFLAVIKICYT